MNISGEIDLAAQSVLDDLCLQSPVDAFAVADALGIVVRDGPKSYCSKDGLVFLGPVVRTERTHFDLAHELGHLLLDTNDCLRCNTFASSLLVPRREFVLHCKTHGRDFHALKRLHQWASFEVLARRYAKLHGLTLFVFDSPPSAPDRYYRAEGRKRWNDELDEFAAYAAFTGERFEIDGVTAYPVVDHDTGWARVLVLL